MVKKLNAIENYIEKLDDVDRTIMRMKYYECAEGEVIAAHVYMTRRTVYKRIDRIIRDMIYWISNTTIY